MKKISALVLAAALCLGLCPGALAASGFTDVPEDGWYSGEIAAMAAAGYIDGYEDGSFRPEGEVSVPEFVTITARCLGLPTGAKDGHWAGVQLEYALENGWLEPGDLFPGAASLPEGFGFPADLGSGPVTRQLAAKLLVCALDLEPGGEAPFTDAGEISAAYAGYVGEAWASGLIQGFEDGSFRPGKALSRAEAAVLIARASGASGGSRLTAAPDGTPFSSSVELEGYDNPNFSLTLSDGRAWVLIETAELWTDWADPESSDPTEAAEGRRRQEIETAMGTRREIPAPAAVTAVYELPCSSWFPGRDANGLIRTEDGAWYFVELSGRNNGGVPQLTELTALRGLEVTGLRYCTTESREGGTIFSGRDYIVAALSSGLEIAAYKN